MQSRNMDQPSRPSLKRGDRVQLKDYPPKYPLFVVAIAGGKIAIGSDLWPVGATIKIDAKSNDIVTINDRPVSFSRRG